MKDVSVGGRNRFVILDLVKVSGFIENREIDNFWILSEKMQKKCGVSVKRWKRICLAEREFTNRMLLIPKHIGT
jgi:hypothetical protein